MVGSRRHHRAMRAGYGNVHRYRPKKPAAPIAIPACSCGKYLEIWNDVFMQYNKTDTGTFLPLSQKNVDTGMGFDRTVAILQGKSSVYDTDVFEGILKMISELSHKNYNDDEETMRAFRIIADHMRCSTFIMGDQRACHALQRGPGLRAAPPDTPRRPLRPQAWHPGAFHAAHCQGR